jgi:hypothetical protein
VQAPRLAASTATIARTAAPTMVNRAAIPGRQAARGNPSSPRLNQFRRLQRHGLRDAAWNLARTWALADQREYNPPRTCVECADLALQLIASRAGCSRTAVRCRLANLSTRRPTLSGAFRWDARLVSTESLDELAIGSSRPIVSRRARKAKGMDQPCSLVKHGSTRLSRRCGGMR